MVTCNINTWHLAAATLNRELQTDFCLTSEAGGGIGGRLQSYAGLDGDMYLRGGGGPAATGVLNTGQYIKQPAVAVSASLTWCAVACALRRFSKLLHLYLRGGGGPDATGVLNTGQYIKQSALDISRSPVHAHVESRLTSSLPAVLYVSAGQPVVKQLLLKVLAASLCAGTLVALRSRCVVAALLLKQLTNQCIS
jgi:hypothetical protein